MVIAHVIDSWTRDADRHDDRYFAVVFVNGLAAPMFLPLAGAALTMAAGSRTRKIGAEAAAASVHRRGWQVFGLAFLFRLQSQLLGLGPIVNLLKVDILNIMGLAMVAAAWLWRVSAARQVRIAIYAAATVMFTMLTPLVREAAWLDPLPDPVEWYFRPVPGRASFTLFPWAGFLMAGALIGELLDAARSPEAERRLHAGLAAGAAAVTAGGYAASFLPTLYENAQFWTSSPTFFFIRLGIIVAVIPIAWLLPLVWAPIVTVGRSSLFVYWIHVEMAYGSAAAPIKRALPLELSVLCGLALSALLYVVVVWKNRLISRHGIPRGLRILAPVLK